MINDPVVNEVFLALIFFTCLLTVGMGVIELVLYITASTKGDDADRDNDDFPGPWSRA
jgi:hypothetical protein